jgi:predicted NBD/HSP70 family sugar kinase
MPYREGLHIGFVPEQVAVYQTDHLLAHPAFAFELAEAVTALQHDQDLIAIDLGGDKIRRADYQVRDGHLVRGDEVVHQARGGDGYLPFLEQVAVEAQERRIPVGISSATRLEGTVVSRVANLPVFYDEFLAAYGADYARLFPQGMRVANDTVAGICGAGTILAQRGVTFDDIAFFICGSGFGAAMIANGEAIHVEAAHVPLMDELNPLGQTMRCHVPGKDYVCLDRVVAGRVGIEDVYRQQTGETLDGVEIGIRYEANDPLSTVLYETSALALVHATAGVMQRFDVSPDERSVVVYHGGNFELGRYRAAIVTDLDLMPGINPRVVFSRDLSPNVCLDGAAILAALAGAGPVTA